MSHRWQAAIITGVLVLSEMQVGAQEQRPDSSSLPGIEKSGQTEMFTFVPSIMASQNYTSNVFFVDPKIVKQAGLSPDDFVSTFTPQALVSTVTDLWTANLQTQGVYGHYINNPSLDYVAVNERLALNLTRAIARIEPNASLNISQSVAYTPTLSAFVEPLPSSTNNANEDNALASKIAPYTSGLQAPRQPSLLLSSSVFLADSITPRTTLRGGYLYNKLTFFSQPVVQVSGRNNFDITSHTLSGQVSHALTQVDRIALSYAYTKADYSSVSASNVDGFNTHSVLASWARQLSPTTGLSLSAGGILTTPANTLYETYSGNIFWRPANFILNASAVRSVFAGITGQAGAYVSDVLSVSLVSIPWVASRAGASFSYARNQFVGNGSTSNTATNNVLNSYNATAYVNHRLSGWAYVSAQYGYGNFEQLSPIAASGPTSIIVQSFTVSLRLIYPSAGNASGIGGGGGVGFY